MTTSTLRQARLELRTSESAKQLIARAASVDGMDLSAFVLNSVMEKARKVLMEHDMINLSEQGQLTLVNLLVNPGEPTQAMRELMALRGTDTLSELQHTPIALKKRA
jgi:uncharacterized protein (DUF1778 family)